MSLGVIDCKYGEHEVNYSECPNLNYSKHWMTPKKKNDFPFKRVYGIGFIELSL